MLRLSYEKNRIKPPCATRLASGPRQNVPRDWKVSGSRLRLPQVSGMMLGLDGLFTWGSLSKKGWPKSPMFF
jgi:hypothetical protein